MSWTNILVPALGGEPDADMLAVGHALAEPFGAILTMAYSSTTPTSLFSLVGEAGVGVSDAAISALQKVSSEGEARARGVLATLDYPRKEFESVTADEWAGLRATSRLADVVVWDPATARGHGFFAAAFQQILMDERRPALVAQAPVEPGGLVAIAWDGGREASRAARRAVPWLRQADEVVVLTAPQAMTQPCHALRLLRYLDDQGVQASAMPLHSRGEAGALLIAAARELGARMLVAGAFGHPRLQRFIFGGTTQVLLESAPNPALFLSH